MLPGYRGELPEALVLGLGVQGSLRLRSGQALRLRGRFASRNGHCAQDDSSLGDKLAGGPSIPLLPQWLPPEITAAGGTILPRRPTL